MEEPVFCPKCEGTQHKHNQYNPRIHHPMVRIADFLVNLWVKHIFFGLIVIPHHEPDERYIPESYDCQTCGHNFLAANTYAEEIRYARDFRRKSLWRGLFFLGIAAFAVVYLIVSHCKGLTSTDDIYLYILPAVSLALSFLFFGGIFFSVRESKLLLEEWKCFQDVQAKHTKANSEPNEYVPAWKRIHSDP